MTPEQQYRNLMSEIGICDDRQEKALVDLLMSKDAELELERARVPDEVSALEYQLMEERTR